MNLVSPDQIDLSSVTEVPWQQLEDDTLQALLEQKAAEFADDQNMDVFNLEQQVKHLKNQLVAKQLFIMFEAEQQQIVLLSKEEKSRFYLR